MNLDNRTNSHTLNNTSVHLQMTIYLKTRYQTRVTTFDSMVKQSSINFHSIAMCILPTKNVQRESIIYEKKIRTYHTGIFNRCIRLV